MGGLKVNSKDELEFNGKPLATQEYCDNQKITTPVSISNGGTEANNKNSAMHNLFSRDLRQYTTDKAEVLPHETCCFPLERINSGWSGSAYVFNAGMSNSDLCFVVNEADPRDHGVNIYVGVDSNRWYNLGRIVTQ